MDAVVAQNPFNPQVGRELITTTPGQLVAEVVKDHWSDNGLECICVVNGALVGQDYMLRDGDMLLIHGMIGKEGKDLFRSIATLGVVVLAAAFTGGAIAPFIGGGTWGGILSGTLVSIGGSLLVNKLLPPASPNLGQIGSGDLETANTYGWNSAINTIQEGGALPILYGTMRVAPYIISKYTKTDGDTQYLNILYALADGQIDSYANVRINDNDSSNYTDVSFVFRDGQESQSVIEAFNDTISETSVATELTNNDTVTRTTSGNTFYKLTVGVVLPRGLSKFNKSNGNIENHSVTLRVRCRPVAGAWTTDDNVITEATQQTKRWAKEYSVTPGTAYEIELSIISIRQEDTTEYTEDVYFDYYQTHVADDFTYPLTSLLAMNALATDQLNGPVPTVTVDITRSTVQVWTGAGYEAKSATNPAWASYDILHNSLYGGEVPYSRLVYAEFEDWADWCDSQSLTCNIYLDAATNLKQTLDLLGTLGRGSVVMRGTYFGAVFDGTSTPVAKFAMGNIVENSFEINYLQVADRANVVEITFKDAANDYEDRTVEVYSEDYESSGDEERRISTMLPGCTNHDMAIRHAKLLINSNKYLVRVIRFRAGIDAVNCQVGDVIWFNHDVPNYGYSSGRVVSATSNTVTIDEEIETYSGVNYYILVRDNDTDALENQLLQNPGDDTTDTFTLNSGTWTTTPASMDLYSIGPNTPAKKFRITDLRREEGEEVTITALEYRSEVYDDTVDIPEYENESTLDPVTSGSVRADDNYVVGNDGQIRDAVVDVTWRGFAVKWQVFYKDGSGPWVFAGNAYNNKFRVTGLEIGHTYTISVTADGNPGNGVTDTVTMTIDPPGQVSNLTAQQLDNNVLLRWTAPSSELPISHYIVKKGGTYSTAQSVGRADKTFTSIFEVAAGAYTYWVAAVDTAGNEGDPASVTVTLTLPSDYQQPTVFLDPFGGARVNLSDDDGLVGPLDLTETWEEHFTDNGATTFQDFIDDGYSLYFEPGPYPTTASYTGNAIDFGAEFVKVTVKLEIDYDVLVGNGDQVQIVPTIRLSEDNVAYADYVGVYEATGESIRYGKVNLAITSDGKTVIRINSIKLTLYLKLYEDGGKGSVTVAATGVTINFNYAFADIQDLQVTARGTTSLTEVVDFVDTPNPTSFTVYLFDETGTKVTGNFSWRAKGV